MILENVAEKLGFVRWLSVGIVNEDYWFSFEFVAAVDPRLVAPVSFQRRFSVRLIAI